MNAIRPGLCSVTFRALAAERIIDLAVEASLESIEWGGDVHVPAGDISRAGEVGRATLDAGLAVASYGSYFRARHGEELTPVLDTAEALGAGRVRIWAGEVGSDAVRPDERHATVARLRDAAAEADARGLRLALEFHAGTLADTASNTQLLLRDVGSPALSSYWQPSLSATDEDAVAEYRALAAHTTAVHVFSWWPVQERHPLSARAALWTQLFAAARMADRPPRDALLEFVPDDDPALLAGEARTLREYISRAG